MKYEYKEKTKLNDYEKFYFQKFFKNNLKRLLAFRKKLGKEIENVAWWRTEYEDERAGQTKRIWKSKGGKKHTIRINKSMIDLYIKSLGYDVVDYLGNNS